MLDILMDTAMDTLKTLPFLLITFIIIEFLEHRAGKKFDEGIKKSGKAGPIIGALLGIFPQCGFSVMGVAFYSKGYITLGTLISIFISTSDEALPILISSSGARDKIIPFIITKVIFAIFWGYVIDFIMGKRKESVHIIEENAKDSCCGEECVYGGKSFKEIFEHSIKRAIKISIYIFLITLSLNILFMFNSVETFALKGFGGKIIEVFAASLIGLIPNCAISVGLVETYLHGALCYGSLIAGLSSNAGLALLVLFKEEENKKIVLKIAFLLFLSSYFSGLILNLLNIRF